MILSRLWKRVDEKGNSPQRHRDTVREEKDELKGNRHYFRLQRSDFTVFFLGLCASVVNSGYTLEGDGRRGLGAGL